MGFKTIVFVLLCSFLGFCTRMFVASLGDTRSDGFSSAASALGYGFVGALTGITGGIIAIRKLTPLAFSGVLKLLVAIFIVISIWIVYRIVVLG